MNLKSIALGAAIAATAIGTTAISPAQAASLDGGLQFASTGAKAAKISNTKVNLQLSQSGPFSIINATGDFVGVTGAPVFKDLILNLTGGTLNNGGGFSAAAPVGSFISGLMLGANPVSFNLTDGAFVGFFKTATNFNLSGFFNGEFVSNGITIGAGSIASLSSTSFAGTSGQVASTAIPTPALLPGLLGLGVAALRKRKGEGSEAEKETVGVKA